MAKKDIFEFKDYKNYLKHWISNKPGHGRGLQTQLAKKLNCQSGYVSQVLNTSAHFSLEQAEGVNQFLGHSYEEGHYFLLLVECARAGTVDLKKRFETEIEKMLQQRLILKDRVDIKKSLEPVHQATYYSAWYYAALHVAVSVPQLRTRSALKNYFQLSEATLSSALDFLVSVGLLEKKGDEYSQGVARLFLGQGSPMLKKHHANWRQKAQNFIDMAIDQGVHFSTVVSLSKSDSLLLKEKVVKAIEDIRSVVRESKEEVVYNFNVDFYELSFRE